MFFPCGAFRDDRLGEFVALFLGPDGQLRVFEDRLEELKGKWHEHGFVVFCVDCGGERGGGCRLEMQWEVGEEVVDYIG